MNRIESEVKAGGMTVFARIDHAAGAAEVGLSLRPTELLIFGNAKGGTPLMQSIQTIGIDLPLKALVWQDESGNTWVSYNDPAWLAKRHGLGPGSEMTTSAMAAGLHAIVNGASRRRRACGSRPRVTKRYPPPQAQGDRMWARRLRSLSPLAIRALRPLGARHWGHRRRDPMDGL